MASIGVNGSNGLPDHSFDKNPSARHHDQRLFMWEMENLEGEVKCLDATPQTAFFWNAVIARRVYSSFPSLTPILLLVIVHAVSIPYCSLPIVRSGSSVLSPYLN